MQYSGNNRNNNRNGNNNRYDSSRAQTRDQNNLWDSSSGSNDTQYPEFDMNEFEEYKRFQKFKQMQNSTSDRFSRNDNRGNRNDQDDPIDNRRSRTQQAPRYQPQQSQQQSDFCRHKYITRQLVAATLMEEYEDISTAPYTEVTIKYHCAMCNRNIFINPFAVGICYGTERLFVDFKLSKKEYERKTILDYSHKRVSKDLLDHCSTLIHGEKTEEQNDGEVEKKVADKTEEQKLKDQKRKEIEEERKKNAYEKEKAIAAKKLSPTVK